MHDPNLQTKPSEKIHNTTAFGPDRNRAEQKHNGTHPRHSPQTPAGRGARGGNKIRLLGERGREREAFWVSGSKERHGGVIQYVCMQQLISTCFNNHPGGGRVVNSGRDHVLNFSLRRLRAEGFQMPA